MPRIPLSIGTGSYESESAPYSAQRCINWMPVVGEDEALSVRALFGSPGIKHFGTVTASITRGCITMNSVPYFVVGGSLHSLASDGTHVVIGDITGSGDVSMAHNGSKLAIVVPGGNGYVYDRVANTLTQITDPDYRPSSTVTFMDGYYIYTASDGSVFFISNLNQPDVIDATDFGSAEISPDLIVAGHNLRNELYIFGEDTGEVFQNFGGEGFPFQRVPGVNSNKGLRATFGVAEVDNTLVFIGGAKEEKTGIWRVSSVSHPVKISTDAIDTKLQEYTKKEIAECYAKSYSIGGRMLADFTIKSKVTESITLVYDATTSARSQKNVWHERRSGSKPDLWRANKICQAYGKLLVGDDRGGLIGELDSNTYTEYGLEIYRKKVCSPFSNKGDPIFYGDLELTMESGVGLTIGQGSSPEIRMSFSDDGARTYTDTFTRKIGAIGEYGHRAVWRRQGRIPAHRVLSFEMSDPVKANILKLEVVANGDS